MRDARAPRIIDAFPCAFVCTPSAQADFFSAFLECGPAAAGSPLFDIPGDPKRSRFPRKNQPFRRRALRKFVLPAATRSGVFAVSICFSMPRDIITLECTEARKEGKPVSRYMSSRNKKIQTERVEKKKYNPHLKRHTVHREIK
jgi:large subunit ribosomal protein L33